MNKLFLFLPLLAVCLMSCTSEKAPKRGTFKRNPEVFHKLKDYSLQLSLLSSRREFYAGDNQVVLTFALKNTGVRPITIYEWHTYEAANLNLYYRPGRAADAGNAAEWKLSRTYDPARINMKSRSPLTLNPSSNQALIQIPAVFIGSLQNPTGKKQTYTLRAVLNLNSVTVQSEPTEIWIK